MMMDITHSLQLGSAKFLLEVLGMKTLYTIPTGSPDLGNDYDGAYGINPGGDVVSRYYDWHVTNSYGSLFFQVFLQRNN